MKLIPRASGKKIFVFALLAFLGAAAAAVSILRASQNSKVRNSSSPESDPWIAAQVISAADLLKEIGAKDPAARPAVVCVGMRTYFKTGHVPGAVLHGPAMSQPGLDDLKKWANGIPRDAPVVVYCGCCPLAGCPNLRPGFLALRDMGFQRLQVLTLPNSFAVDWAEKGYPTERGE
jgi:thiosulfate/3-mercaptopyruvate sulfurtransferase